jgi:hypothetical protein
MQYTYICTQTDPEQGFADPLCFATRLVALGLCTEHAIVEAVNLARQFGDPRLVRGNDRLELPHTVRQTLVGFVIF